MSNGKLFIGLALGALAGGALACLAHSHKGKRLKKNVCNAFNIRCSCDDCGCEEGHQCEEHHRCQYPEPDEVIEVVAGKMEHSEEKPKD